jgi:hypothetical protein
MVRCNAVLCFSSLVSMVAIATKVHASCFHDRHLSHERDFNKTGCALIESMQGDARWCGDAMAKSSQDTPGSTCRTTVTLPREDHELLERLAEVKHVSLAWMIRDAIRTYLDQQTPLFAPTAHHQPGAS